MTNYNAIVFFDLDGTLLDANEQVTPEIKTALQELKANHILPVVNTGRPPVHARAIAAEAGIDSFIAMNGMYIVVDEEVVSTTEMDKEDVRALLAEAKTNDGMLVYYSNENIFLSEADENLRHFFHEMPPIQEEVFETAPINMVVLRSFDPATDDAYREKFPMLNFFRNAPFAIDVMIAGADKGFGAEKLVEAINANGVPTYAFGDGENDVHLLQAVTHGIAMGNGIPKVKEVAEFVTTENTNKGIINGLKYFNLIK
jgi:Cof subfamily protein (haloacid dehalogenase superfamily)